ncbi:MAG: glycosyltransferase family 52 [Bacteroidia bacterium]
MPENQNWILKKHQHSIFNESFNFRLGIVTMKNTAENIFICYTPLHILISEKIIQLEKIDSYILVFYVEKDNKKNRYYFDKLALGAKKSFYIKKDNKYFSALKTFYFLYLKLRNYPHSNFFTGNIKSVYSRFIICLLGFNKLVSFDDGMGNIWGSGYFYEDRIPSFFARALSYVRLDFTYSRMYQNIYKHYTIYYLPNVMPHSVYISLFEQSTTANDLAKSNDNIVILLTSTWSEYDIITIEKEREFYDKIIKRFNVTHIIPHPLEKIRKTINPNVEVIDSEKIAEEIIMEMRQRYDKIKIVGIYSSALINLKQITDVEVVNVYFNFNSSETITRFLAEAGIETCYI